MTDALLAVKALTKTFNADKVPVHALKALTFAIEQGEFVALTGHSGCGKSTLLSILGLLDEASAGDYWLSGHHIRDLSAFQKAALRNRNIGWVFQNFNLISDMTVLENIVLPLQYNKAIAKSQYRSLAETVLAEVGLSDKVDSYPDQLSGGQQQRVAIARALITKPDILLADEPTGNLDSVSEQAIFELFKKLNAEGVTILLVTHSARLAEQCSRVLHMKDGELVAH
ncbi:ABC transporter ATP-binding protein [Gallaecimonas mangrovi]|uniref:ABC transporter ATP-binding protein n=1 Tax=Gallaecimonas mangrovi TaxID=2291597 RepID=UPI000E20BDED|nr:ABC transporter ATP-binding protein [Gallaecimonas mangrovi]